MSAIDTAPAGAAFTADEADGVTRLLVDIRIGSLLAREVSSQVVTRAFGVPREAQSFLATMVLFGAAGTVVREMVSRPLPHPSGVDALAGVGVLNAALGGLAGPAAAAVPLAGGMIAFAVVAHALRPTVHKGRALAHAGWAAFDGRYAHHSHAPRPA